MSDFIENDYGTWYVPGDRPATAAEAQLLDENERLSRDVRRLRAENQWLRNRRNRAVELLTGNPGDDPMFIAADLMETLTTDGGDT